VLDWGDSSISHPFASLVVTFRFLGEFYGLSHGDPWFHRLRQAYLEPWRADLAGAFPLALKLGSFAHAFGWLRQRETLTPAQRSDFDTYFAVVLRQGWPLECYGDFDAHGLIAALLPSSTDG
jgi:hypothetical protein